MDLCDTLIHNVLVIDGTGGEPFRADVAIQDGMIAGVGKGFRGRENFDGGGQALAPGFIDTHTHDDLVAIRQPDMLPKISQGVTTVIVGNCGISAAPVRLKGELPDPMNLLGERDQFGYAHFAEYVDAVNGASPSLNVAALVGHTALRNNHLDRLDRVATGSEIEQMQAQIQEALDGGALGLSTGLAYRNASSASTEEVMALAEPLADTEAVYTTHLRSETAAILDAMEEAFRIGRHAKVPVVVSHLKCAGIDNWGRTPEVLECLQDTACDCYPYAAGSSTLDLGQVDPRVTIKITWSTPHPEVAGKTLAQISEEWAIPQLEAARRLQPAGAIYHSISEEDMQAILSHPGTMIGSDGLPNDPRPHPRLWGTFPRVLGRYSRELKLFPLSVAVHKMTGLPASRFGLGNRGLIREGFAADLVLFNPDTVIDRATFEEPIQASEGIEAVWVNGVLSYHEGRAHGRVGRFIKRANKVGLPHE